MEHVGCSVMLYCAAVYRGVYMEQVGCSVVTLHCAAVFQGSLYVTRWLFCCYVAPCSSLQEFLYGARRLFCYIALCSSI